MVSGSTEEISFYDLDPRPEQNNCLGGLGRKKAKQKSSASTTLDPNMLGMVCAGVFRVMVGMVGSGGYGTEWRDWRGMVQMVVMVVMVVMVAAWEVVENAGMAEGLEWWDWRAGGQTLGLKLEC